MSRNCEAGINLMIFKAKKQLCEGKSTCYLDENDINEILIACGMGVLTPDSLQEKDIEVIV